MFIDYDNMFADGRNGVWWGGCLINWRRDCYLVNWH